LNIKANYILLIAASLLLPLLYTNALKAQDPYQELQEINTAYDKAQQFSAKLVYRLFANHAATMPMQTEKATVIKDGLRQYYKLGQLEMLQTPSWHLMADHEEKSIAIMKIFGEQDPVTPIDFEQITSLLKQTSGELRIRKLESNLQRLIILPPAGASDYSKVYLDYLPESHLLKVMHLFYAQPPDLTAKKEEDAPRLEIQFESFDPESPLPNNVFSYHRFFKEQAGSFSLRPDYKAYQLIDHYHLR